MIKQKKNKWFTRNNNYTQNKSDESPANRIYKTQAPWPNKSQSNTTLKEKKKRSYSQSKAINY